VKALLQWIKSNRVMLFNSGSLVGTTAVTSSLGFVFWWVAARMFPPEAVGIASAASSATTLLGNICMLGLGTLLITELPRQPGREGSLISTALVMVGGVGGGIGILFAVLAPYASAQFYPLKASAADIVVFAAGVSLTAIFLVLDQALIGILRGDLQFWRNAFFAVLRLILLFMIGLYLSQKAGMTIYTTWPTGIALSLAALLGFALRKRGGLERACLPQWGLVRKLGPAALQHHLLNLLVQVPPMVLPVLVAALVSAQMNAVFYVSWMMASFLVLVPIALTSVLQAMNSAQQSSLRYKARVTLGVSFVTSLVAVCLFELAAKQVLGLLGSSYAEQGASCLRILVLATFPSIIKSHYLSICRIQDRVASAMRGMLAGGVLELVGAAVGVRLGGILGGGLGLVVAATVEALFMIPRIYQTVRPADGAWEMADQESYREIEAISLVDTIIDFIPIKTEGAKDQGEDESYVKHNRFP
jgi:O-antigen/teichoic acid export membrane protein